MDVRAPAALARRGPRDQASWWVRVIALLAADARIAQVRLLTAVSDGRPPAAARADAAASAGESYATPDGASDPPRAAVELLQSATSASGDSWADVAVAGGPCVQLSYHAFHTSDGRRVLVVWNGYGACAVAITLHESAQEAFEHLLDARTVPLAAFDGRRISEVRLEGDHPRIFEFR